MAAKKVIAAEAKAAEVVDAVTAKPPPKNARAKKNDSESGKVKRTRKPSMFNFFVKKRISEMINDSDIMAKFPTHKQRFAESAREWKAMDKDEQERLKTELAEEFKDLINTPKAAATKSKKKTEPEEDAAAATKSKKKEAIAAKPRIEIVEESDSSSESEEEDDD